MSSTVSETTLFHDHVRLSSSDYLYFVLTGICLKNFRGRGGFELQCPTGD